MERIDRGSCRKSLLVALAAGVATFTVSSLASGAVGSLAYRGCITGETQSGPGGSGACRAIAGAASFGENSGLDGMSSVALSGDGRWLYAASGQDAAVASFRRNRDTGRLAYRGCISGQPGIPCSQIPFSGNNSGLGGPAAVALSSDGRFLYAASRSDDAVARFRRNRDTGRLAYQGCISGDDESACTAIPDAGEDGENSGLDELASLALSGDGKFLYAVSTYDDAVSRFRRNRDTGRLTYRGCISGDDESACREIPNAGPFGSGSGLDNLKALALSRDGKFLYTASDVDDAVSLFRRNRDTGRLTYRGCISGQSPNACRKIPAARGGADGRDSGLGSLQALALSGDGKFLYAVSTVDDAVSRFRRNRDTGRLTYQGCISGERGTACRKIPAADTDGANSGLDTLTSLALSGDGKSLYTASSGGFYNESTESYGDSAVARFRRNRDTGRLTYRGCISGDSESACREIPSATPGGFGENSGLESLQALALSRDGRFLYTASSGDAAVARFRRER